MGLKTRLLLPVAKHFIAGEGLDDVIEVGKTLNRQGFKLVVNYLGEDITTQERVSQSLQEYLGLLDVLDKNQMSGSVSVKLTQLGLSISKEIAAQSLAVLMQRADEQKRYVWLDMEDSPYTSQTIEVYLDALKRWSGLGVAMQAYMKRSADDLEAVLAGGGQVRLVKGAYNESPSIVYKDKNEIREHFTTLMERLFSQGNFFAVATHDEQLLKRAARLANDTKNQNFEFEMLRGVRESRSAELVENGFKVSVYVPYGKAWLPYAMRRVRERRRNILFMAKAVLRLG